VFCANSIVFCGKKTHPNIKAKLITGTYTLQANRAKFNQHSVSSTFLLCKSDSEDRIHLVLHCTTYTHIWDKHLNTLQLLMSENFDRCIVDKVYSHLVYSHLVYSHLVYTHLVYSHLVYSRKMIVLHLVYSMNFINYMQKQHIKSNFTLLWEKFKRKFKSFNLKLLWYVFIHI
jgi:hypothetical protein